MQTRSSRNAVLANADDSDDNLPTNGIGGHTESRVEADVEAKDQLKDDLMSEIEETQGSEVAKAERDRVSPTGSNGDDEDDDDNDDDEEK